MEVARALSMRGKKTTGRSSVLPQMNRDKTVNRQLKRQVDKFLRGVQALPQELMPPFIKFRREHPPTVCISAEAREIDWLFSVRDNSIGIEPGNADRIFAIFQRLHTADEYPVQAWGLGCARRSWNGTAEVFDWSQRSARERLSISPSQCQEGARHERGWKACGSSAG